MEIEYRMTLNEGMRRYFERVLEEYIEAVYYEKLMKAHHFIVFYEGGSYNVTYPDSYSSEEALSDIAMVLRIRRNSEWLPAAGMAYKKESVLSA